MAKEDARISADVTAKLKAKRRKKNLHWISLLGVFEAGDFIVVPLTSSNDLREEGELMNHCVGRRYHRWCYDGAVRVFSIRDLSDNRLATASLYFDFDTMFWRIEQCKGYGNREVCEIPIFDGGSMVGTDLSDIHFVAQQIVTLYQHAQEIHDAKEQIEPRN